MLSGFGTPSRAVNWRRRWNLGQRLAEDAEDRKLRRRSYGRKNLCFDGELLMDRYIIQANEKKKIEHATSVRRQNPFFAESLL